MLITKAMLETLTSLLVPLAAIVGMTLYHVVVRRRTTAGRVASGPMLDPGPPLPLHAGSAGNLGFQWRIYEHEILGSVWVPAHWEQGLDAGSVAFYDEQTGAIIRIQRQLDVRAQSRVRYTESFVDVNRRDAPGYELLQLEYGSLGSLPVARTQGCFDDDEQYYTRSYVIFTKGTAVMVMGRAPVPARELLTNVLDAMAGSLARA